MRFEYDCFYQPTPTHRKRTDVVQDTTSQSISIHPATPSAHSETRPPQSISPNPLRSLEANSGAAFVRRLALRIDPTNAPRFRLFPWNAFLGARQAAGTPVAQPITDMLSQAHMETLTAIYFDKIDPCYGFIDRHDLEQHVRSRWTSAAVEDSRDAELCGVAALGCLFSQVHPPALELDLVESAKRILELKLSDIPSITSIRACVLRVAYLRMAGTPHMAWMASCVLMHMIEAAGLHCEPSEGSVLNLSREDIDPELRRRLFGIARHLNIWMAFDIGHSRVSLHNTTTVSPSARPGCFTAEFLELLQYSEILDPDKCLDVHELQFALSKVLERDHSEPPLVQAQCNLTLCICRRLQALNVVFTGSLLQQILALTTKGIRASQAMVKTGSPWHHMVNVPFQVVCILLAIDTSTSISQLRDVMQCLSNIATTYNTEATQEALRTASLLILLHQRRKELDASRLNEVLSLYPAVNLTDAQNTLTSQQPEDIRWLDGLMEGIPSLQGFDLDQFFSGGF